MIGDGLLIVLKYAGSIIAAAYGVYATLTDFKERKDGKKVLSRKGYVGIALLMTSSVFALSTGALQDYKEAQASMSRARQEAENRKEDLNRVENIISGLTTVKDQLGFQTRKIDDTQQSMEASFGLTNQISNNLGEAATTLAASSRKTNAILHESTENISYIDITMEFAIIPDVLRAVKDESGQSIISKELMKRFKEEDDSAEEEILERLQANSALIRSRVVQKITVGSFLQDSQPRPFLDFFSGTKQLFYFAGNDALINFLSMPESLFQFSHKERRIYCLLTYRLLPNRFSGIRKFRDLNGLIWNCTLVVDPTVVEPRIILLDVGQTNVFESKGFIMLAVAGIKRSEPHSSTTSLLEADGDGKFHGEVTIPNRFF